MPDIIRGNKIDFVESASNLGIIFNSGLTWSNNINVVVGKVYGISRNLWAVIESTHFAICSWLKRFRFLFLYTDPKFLAYKRPYITIFLPDIWKLF